MADPFNTEENTLPEPHADFAGVNRKDSFGKKAFAAVARLWRPRGSTREHEGARGSTREHEGARGSTREHEGAGSGERIAKAARRATCSFSSGMSASPRSSGMHSPSPATSSARRSSRGIAIGLGGARSRTFRHPCAATPRASPRWPQSSSAAARSMPSSPIRNARRHSPRRSFAKSACPPSPPLPAFPRRRTRLSRMSVSPAAIPTPRSRIR